MKTYVRAEAGVKSASVVSIFGWLAGIVLAVAAAVTIWNAATLTGSVIAPPAPAGVQPMAPPLSILATPVAGGAR